MRPIIIGVGGAHSGSGKTTYACLLLEKLGGWGAIKYTKTGMYASITDEPGVLMTADKDTRRMLDSGAERVLWVQSPPSELVDILPMAVERLSDLRGVIVEGNSAIEFLKPDIIIFIFGGDPGILKGSAKDVLRKADVIVSEGEFFAETQAGAKRFRRSPDDTGKLLEYVMDIVDRKEKIRSSLRERSADGKVSCHVARKIAEDLSVPYREVGEAADEAGIKIIACELGCF